MTRIKICGLTRAEDALFAAEQGADFLGFIFIDESPRRLDVDRAAAIARRIRGLNDAPQLVGVFRNMAPDDVRRIATQAALDLVQLQGSETEEDIRAIGFPAIKTVHVSDTLPDTKAHPSAKWLLFDTYDTRRSGGTGQRFDWSLLAIYERAKPFFLAGGIHPDNVAAALSLVRPDGIDVASGVESEPGIKDHEKIERLIERVRRA